MSQLANRVMLVVCAAVAGAALLVVPPIVVNQYETARELGQVWGALYLVAIGLGGVLLLGSLACGGLMIWANSRSKQRRRQRELRNPSELTTPQIEQEVDEHQAELDRLADGDGLDNAGRQRIRDFAESLEQKRERRTLELVAFGTISSGKSTLLNALSGGDGDGPFQTSARGGTTVTRHEVDWPGADRARLVDTPGIGEVDDVEHARIARESARDADLVLFVIEGPLRAGEFALLEILASMEKRILACLNKSDWYTDAERDELLDQVATQLEGKVAREDVVWIRAGRVAQRRVRIRPDGTEEPVENVLDPDISALAERMLQVVIEDGRDLLLANLLLRSRSLVIESRELAQTTLDKRAAAVVEGHMWGAAGAAAILPGMGVDLAVSLTAAVRMVNELAKVYQQQIDAGAVSRMVEQMPKHLLAVMGVNALTPAITSVVASAVKAVPGLGTVAGGVMQGLTQAVIMKWLGAVFTTYFRNEMNEPPGGMAMLAREKWDEVTSAASMKQIVSVGLTKLRSRV